MAFKIRVAGVILLAQQPDRHVCNRAAVNLIIGEEMQEDFGEFGPAFICSAVREMIGNFGPCRVESSLNLAEQFRPHRLSERCGVNDPLDFRHDTHF